MTERELIRAYRMAFREKFELMMDNVYIGEKEMDLCCVRKSGYWCEIEIKTSVSDFAADFRKTQLKSYYGPYRNFMDIVDGHDGRQLYAYPHRSGKCRYVRREKLKHELIQSGQGLANEFWFLLPETLYEKIGNDIPDGYGVLVAKPSQIAAHGPWVSIVKKAKKFHDRKIDERTKVEILRKAMFRYWDMKAQRAAA